MTKKKLIITMLPIAAALAGIGAQYAAAADPSPLEFSYNGYFRTGIGSNSKGGSQQCFQAPGALAKYRLGNECGTYGELDLSAVIYRGKAADGPVFKAHTMLSYFSSQANGDEPLSPVSGNFNQFNNNGFNSIVPDVLLRRSNIGKSKEGDDVIRIIEAAMKSAEERRTIGLV